MARVIQEHIKKALADEVLFGRLKTGGHVRVIVVTDEAGNSKLSFDYPEGPVTPRQEKLAEPRRVKANRRSTPRRKPLAHVATTRRRAAAPSRTWPLSKCEARCSEDQSNLELSMLPQLVP